MTEGGVGTTLRAHERPDKLDTVGVANPGVQMFVIDDAGQVLAQGSVGELVGRSPSMMSGYYGRGELVRCRRPALSKKRRHRLVRCGRVSAPARSQEGHHHHQRRIQRLRG